MIKVGITEIDIGYEDKEYAREHCLEVMQEAYENGVELLVFPEMTLTGFTMMPARMWEAYRDGEIPESVSFFMENSRKYDMAMAFGYIEAFMADGSGEFDESRRKVFENKLAIVSGDEVIMDYAKIHPFSFSGEDRVYRAGSRICQANVKDLRLGGYICYDLRFPEIFSDSYIISTSVPRFGTGEAKGVIKESVRGYDLYLMVDVTNYSLTYSVSGHENHMSPDDHYADLKRIIAAVGGKARRITAIIPFLYESRQHKRTARESLDCALAEYGRRFYVWLYSNEQA